MHQKKLAIIGKPYNIALFKIFGSKAFEVYDAENLKDVIKDIEDRIDEFGVILVTADVFSGEKNIKKLKSLGIPVIPIPTNRSEAGVAEKTMEQLVNKAVGMNLDFLK